MVEKLPDGAGGSCNLATVAGRRLHGAPLRLAVDSDQPKPLVVTQVRAGAGRGTPWGYIIGA